MLFLILALLFKGVTSTTTDWETYGAYGDGNNEITLSGGLYCSDYTNSDGNLLHTPTDDTHSAECYYKISSIDGSTTSEFDQIVTLQAQQSDDTASTEPEIVTVTGSPDTAITTTTTDSDSSSTSQRHTQTSISLIFDETDSSSSSSSNPANANSLQLLGTIPALFGLIGLLL